jgi:3-dehydroquinate synthase
VSPERVEIRVGDAASVAWVGRGVLEDPRRFLESPSGRWLLVASRNAGAVGSVLRRALSSDLLLDLEIADSEEGKTLDVVASIADRAIAAGVRRDDAFVAAGGGVVTDLVGFAAAIVLRGIAWNAVPTTVAGMADAAIGGKTGVDHALGKNLIGAFHMPRSILIDPSAAATLPPRDFASGLVEAFKGAWIADAGLSALAGSRLDVLLDRDEDALGELLAGVVRIKAAIVSSDPFERGPRRLLNFGHTLGHAFEAAGGYRDLRHGEAVAWGIAAALTLSAERAGLPAADSARIRSVLARLGPFPEPVRAPEALEPLLARDKKATSRGLAGVLLESVGRARVEESIPISDWLAAAEHVSIS